MTRQPDDKPAAPAAGASANKCTTSTRWEWKKVKISRPPEGGKHSRPKGARWYLLPRWDRRRALTMRVVLRGGSECYVEVQARGSRGIFHGSEAIYDVLREVMALD